MDIAMTPAQAAEAGLIGTDLAARLDVLSAARDADIAAIRREVIRLAPLLCDCDSRFDWADRRPPQASCPVHGNDALWVT